MTRALFALLLAFPVLLGTACGGGGGGDDPPALCTKPGSVIALAIQGQPAPDTAGNYGPMPVGMLMDAGIGGWAVYVAPTTDATNALCLFVAQPDGTVLKVFRTGEVVPDAGGGTISGFLVARVNEVGQVLAEVQITGGAGARAFGLLTAQVVGGVVTSKMALAYHLQDMTVTGVDGVLTDIDETRITFLDDGRVTFGGTTNDPAEAVWIVDLDGTNLESLIATGDSLPDIGNPAVTCLDIRAFGVTQNGAGFGFVADVGGTFEDRLYIGSTSSSGYAEVASDGNALPGGGSVLEIHGGGPLLVFNNGVVLWKAIGNGAPPDDVILAGSSVEPYIELARSGDFAPGASGGFFGELDLLAHRGQCQFPEMKAELFAVPGGADFATYVVGSGSPLLAVFEGRAAPPDFDETTMFSDELPGLSAAGTFDIASDGAFGFAGLMQNGSNGMFWIVPGCGTFTLAKDGEDIPGGGDTFGSFSPQATHTTNDDTVVFRALLDTAGSGVFRQAP